MACCPQGWDGLPRPDETGGSEAVRGQRLAGWVGGLAELAPPRSAVRGRGGAMVAAVGVGAMARVGLNGGKLAGLPEQEDLFQPAEQAGEASHDQGVHGRGYPGRAFVRRGGEAHAGKPVAQRGLMN